MVLLSKERSRTKKVDPVVIQPFRVKRAGEPRVTKDHESREKEDKIIYSSNCLNVN